MEGRRWRHEEVRELLEVWPEYIDKLNSCHRTAPVYQEMAKKLNINPTLDLGGVNTITGSDISKKIFNLKRQYRAERKKMKTGRSTCTWWAYNIVHEILRNHPRPISNKSNTNDSHDSAGHAAASGKWESMYETDDFPAALCKVESTYNSQELTYSNDSLSTTSLSTSSLSLTSEDDEGKSSLPQKKKRKKDEKRKSVVEVLSELLAQNKRNFAELMEFKKKDMDMRQESMNKLISVFSSAVEVQNKIFETLSRDK